MSGLSALILAVLLATLVVLITGRPWWPVVDYPMFARAQKRGPSERTEIYLVHDDVETLLPPEDRVFSRDFDSVGARQVIVGLAKKGGFASSELRRFLTLVLEAQRPEPTAIRLYRVRQDYETPSAYRRRTIAKVLLLEVTK